MKLQAHQIKLQSIPTCESMKVLTLKPSERIQPSRNMEMPGGVKCIKPVMVRRTTCVPSALAERPVAENGWRFEAQRTVQLQSQDSHFEIHNL